MHCCDMFFFLCCFQRNAEGRELFEKVCQHLDLIEKDYFGLQYTDERIANHLKVSETLTAEKKCAYYQASKYMLFYRAGSGYSVFLVY